MKNTWFISILIGLAVAELTAAETLWANGVSLHQGWKDYNKNRIMGDAGDSGLCWALTAANLLDWWQEQHSQKVPAAAPRGLAIQHCFRSAFKNEAGDPDKAMLWWFTGNYNTETLLKNAPSATLIDPSKGGYYRHQSWTASSILYYGRGKDVTADSLTQALWNGFKRGDAFWIGVSYQRPDASRASHALTVWGIDAEQDTKGNKHIRAIYMTDSDDARHILHRIPIKKQQGMLYFDCPSHPLYGRIGNIIIDTYTGLRLRFLTP